MFVRENDTNKRREILECLENMGYRLDESEPRTRQEIIDSVLPITVDEKKKEYRMMGNVTCAAAAASSGCLITREEFFKKI